MGDVALALDLDGTLHQGMGWLNPRGYSNIELVARHAALHRPPWRQRWRLLREMLALRRLDRELLRGMARGERTMAERDRLLIERYVERVLRELSAEEFARVAARMPEYRFREADRLFASLPGEIAEIVLVSKSFVAVLDAYARHLGGLCGRPVAVLGNRLLWEGERGPPRLDARERLLSREDKEVRLRQWLERRPALRRLIAVGDTEEDRGLFSAGRGLLGAGRTLAIAIHERDAILAAAADVRARDWGEAERVIHAWVAG